MEKIEEELEIEERIEALGGGGTGGNGVRKEGKGTCSGKRRRKGGGG